MCGASARVLKYSNVHAHVYLMKETDTASEILCVPITPGGKQSQIQRSYNAQVIITELQDS